MTQTESDHDVGTDVPVLQTDPAKLIDFYRRIHPFGPGWRYIRLKAGVSDKEAAVYATHENIPLSMLGWVTGSMMIWSALFAVGNYLYGRMGYAAALTALFAVSAVVLTRVVNRLWN